jgi:hypothetical protein
MDDESNTPDAPASPAQPAGENPAWVDTRLLSGASAASTEDVEADQTPVETLAEKHKARRQTFHRLVSTVETPPEEPDLPAEPVEALETPLPAGTMEDSPQPEESLLEASLQKVKGFTRGVGQRAQGLWQRTLGQRARGQGPLEQRSLVQHPALDEQPLQVEEPAPELRPAGRAKNVWPRMRPYLWRGRLGPAFWTVASILSLVVNLILIVVLILLGRQLFFLKERVVNEQLINGLYNNFVLMDQAHIQTTITVSDTIQVKDTIPVVFDLPLNQKTTVVLTKDTPVKNATIYLNGAAVPLDLDLREGTELSIKLDMTVPVQQTVPVVLNVPVNLKVPVDIPLDQTQLHEPFVGLQQVVLPFRNLLGDVPDSWGEICKGPMKIICTVTRFK